MADIDNQPEATLPAKRKSDLSCHEQKNKTLKLQPVGSNSVPAEGELHPNDEEKIDKEVHDDSKEGSEEVEEDEDDEGDDDGEEDEEDDDDDDDDEEDDDGDEEELSAEPVVDRKGKGISRDDKGKGKMIEEEDSGDDDDSSDGENQSDDDSDLSDDPMAEVDLDNILPSRTRRRVVQPSLNISKGVANEGDDSDDDDA